MKKKPNFLLINTDQLRRDAIGIYSNRVIKTPNLDKLALDGVCFDNHFTQSAACTPARWTILTGKYPKVHGVKTNGSLFNHSELTLTRILSEEGYHTGAFGKMHLAPALLTKYDESENWPSDNLGFSTHRLTDDAKKGLYLDFLKKESTELYDYVMGQGQEKVEEDLMSAAERKFDLAPQIKENRIPAELHQTTWTADQAIDFIKDQKEPFFAWCSFVDPHHPFDPPEPYASMYDPEVIPEPPYIEGELEDKPKHFKDMLLGYSPGNEKYDFSTISALGWKTVIAKYYGMVSLIDYNIGRIVNTLKERNMYENTIIMFTSDHGELLGDHGLMFKGPFHYDSLIRVPLIVCGKNYLSSGLRVSDITQHTDIASTILGIAGIKKPYGMQGRSMETFLQGEFGKGYDFGFVDDYSCSWGFNVKTLRSKDYRFTWYGGYSFGELYDLKEDPEERKNLWDNYAYKHVKEDLKEALINKLIETENMSYKKVTKY